MQTRLIVFLSATAGIVLLIIIGIIITVLVTGKVVAEKNEKEMKRRWLIFKAKDKKEDKKKVD
ncbi:MAG: hypothetical protein IJQ72_03060 [Bacilli bacterium]|nr:hypothetical protein [Bacilli bacterium]